MRTAVLVVVLSLALVTFIPAAAVASGPCPQNCTPPEPCGWAPDIRKSPAAWAQFWVDCARDAPW